MPYNSTNKALAHSWRCIMHDTNITLYLKNCPLPGFGVGSIDLGAGSDHFTLIAPGTRAQFDELSMDFFISEDWSNYLEIYNMIMSYLQTYKPTTNDITLQMFDNTNNIIKSFVFEDCFPTRVSTIETTVIDENSFLTCTAIFEYTRWSPIVD